MRGLVICLWLGAGLLLAGCGVRDPAASAETTILTGPRFWTEDPAHPWAQGLLVREGRIVRYLDRQEMAREAARGGTIRQLSGGLAVPGLVDAHAHILGYGLSRTKVDLVGTQTLDEALSRVAAFAQAHPDKLWIEGRGWDQNDWPDHAWPSADRLEQVVPDRPCALRRVDGHALWVNRAALTAAGINFSTPDPPGGMIYKDGSGRPTGILVDNAADLVLGKIPEPSDGEIEQALETAAKDLLAVGLTGVHDMGIDRRTWKTMKRLAAKGRFPLRVFAYASDQSELAREILARGTEQSGRLHLVGIKFYADGALGSRGARLLEPYTDDPYQKGLWVTPPEQLRERIGKTLEAGLQPAVHAIGDAANKEVIDDYIQALESAGGRTAFHPRLEHAQIVDLADIPRVAEHEIVASMQPTHATSDMPWALDRVGPRRLRGAYAWRRFLDAGALLAFGSDFPVESIDPRLGLYAAVTRQDIAGEPPGGWLPGQRLTLAEAVAAFTRGAAQAVGAGRELGTMEPGHDCDLTVFERNLFNLPPSAILETPVTATVIAGRVFLPTAETRSPASGKEGPGAKEPKKE